MRRPASTMLRRHGRAPLRRCGRALLHHPLRRRRRALLHHRGLPASPAHAAPPPMASLLGTSGFGLCRCALLQSGGEPRRACYQEKGIEEFQNRGGSGGNFDRMDQRALHDKTKWARVPLRSPLSILLKIQASDK
ncbi:hypothetical protein BRADI_2g27962v3 [Brachypodium distachyon]|uniref:Uncharacterized protein n=1 Tax=Brachypodium distachyon TaxID=15368 RepID=A0A0Q3G5T5_BRADI|nr:hypothetical protein BRADI_2g27962v3 [Brachypodium distachyon]